VPARGRQSGHAAPKGYLKVTMPFFWQRHGGADHIFFATGDKGFCGKGRQSPIYISHFGLMSGFRGGMYPGAAAEEEWVVLRATQRHRRARVRGGGHASQDASRLPRSATA